MVVVMVKVLTEGFSQKVDKGESEDMSSIFNKVNGHNWSTILFYFIAEKNVLIRIFCLFDLISSTFFTETIFYGQNRPYCIKPVLSRGI